MTRSKFAAPSTGASASGRPMVRREFLQLGIGALGAAALSPPSPSLAMASPSGDEEKLLAAARKEGKVVWWTAHYALNVAEGVRDAFIAKYPGIQVEFIRQTAQVIYQRLSQNLKAQVREVDVFASTDEAHYLTLKSQRALAAFTPAGISCLLKAFQNLDPDGTYHLGARGFVLINHRAKLPDPPRKWTDLL